MQITQSPPRESPSALSQVSLDFLEQTSHYAVIMLDSRGYVTAWNKGAESLFGYAPPDIIGRDFACLYPRRSVRECHPKSALASAKKTGCTDIQCWYSRQDGAEFFAAGTLTLLWNDGAHGFLKVVRDQTPARQQADEHAALLQRERAARATAEAASQIKDEFLGNIAHELRTPLTAILLWSRILRGGKIDDKDRQEAIATIERSANAQSELIEDLLDISRMMSGKLRLNIREMALAPAVEAAVKAARVLADAKAISIITELGPQPGSVRADPVRIQQVVWNLLTNAVRFTPNNGVIQVKLDRSDRAAHLSVTDTGAGIPADALPHVFDGFLKSDAKPTRHAGLGLGLALARQLVELHGGAIRAHSDGAQRGATFTVEIPLVIARDQSPLAARPAGRAAGDFGPSKLLAGIRVLIVDDEPDTRYVIRWLLEQSGADVTAVGSAVEALATLASQETHPPHILLSDIGMPGEDGHELLRHVRQREKDRGAAHPLPAVAITAYTLDEDRRRALETGYQAFIPKPIEPADLLRVVTELIAPRAK